MFKFFLFMVLIFLCVFFMFLLNLIFSKKFFKNRNKISSFECGFDSVSFSRLPFSLQFYLIGVIFLIFDVEISLILPLIYLNDLNYYEIVFFMLFMISILLLGLYLEWFEGALFWFKFK